MFGHRRVGVSFWLWLVVMIGSLGVIGGHGVADAQSETVTMPEGWEDLEAGEFAAAAEAYLSQRPTPTGDLIQQVVQHAWEQFLSEDAASATSAPLPTLVTLATTLRPHANLLRGDDGSPLDVTAVEARLQEVVASVREQFEQNSGVVGVFDFPQLWRLWYGIIPPGEPPGAERFVIPRDFAEQRAAAFATWMETHDWPSLLLGYRMWLEEGLVFDEVNTEAFSVRWTGQVTAPADGAYRFGQLNHPLADGTCRIFLADQLVFETEALPADAAAEPAQLGEAVMLQAGQPAPLRVEYVYDRAALADRLSGASLLQVDSSLLDRLYPMMVLMWEGPGGLQIVSPDALSPPAPNPENVESGLLCESFNGLDLATPAATTITPGVGSVWTVAPVVPRYSEQLAEVHADCFTALIEDPQGAPMVYDLFVFARFAGMLDVWQRQELLDLLLSQPQLLQNIELLRFARLYEELALLPGDARLRLLTTWGEQYVGRMADRLAGYELRPGVLHHYSHGNHEGPRRIAATLVGRHADDLDRLVTEELETSEGRPQLPLIRVAAHGRRLQQRVSEFRTWLETKVNEQVPGDEMALWLMAQGWAEEAFAGEYSRAAVGLPYFEAARAAATSPDVQFETALELTIRQVALGLGDEALTGLDAMAGEFTAPEQQQIIADLRAAAASYDQLLTQGAEQARADAARDAAQAHAGRLEARIAKAQARGDAAAAAKYQQQLQQLELSGQE